jgi:hypothetical protein
MSATLVYRHREDFDDGAILEMVIWRMPKPITGSQHPYKYRLFYGRAGQREVGYDNERPKGDHRRYGSRGEPYRFESPERLVDDFLRDIAQRRAR